MYMAIIFGSEDGRIESFVGPGEYAEVSDDMSQRIRDLCVIRQKDFWAIKINLEEPLETLPLKHLPLILEALCGFIQLQHSRLQS